MFSGTPPPAYSPTEESQHAPSPTNYDRPNDNRDQVMDTGSVPEVAPVSYQVDILTLNKSVIKLCILNIHNFSVRNGFVVFLKTYVEFNSYVMLMIWSFSIY